MAKFLVRDTFNITGRGYVLAGEVTLGVINTGDFLVLKVNGEVIGIKITGVEMVDKRSEGIAHVALVVSFYDKGKIEKLDLKGQELIVSEPPDTGSSSPFWNLIDGLFDFIELMPDSDI